MNTEVKEQDRVRLTEPVPTLWLEHGEIGVVQSVWRSSPGFCEVEFRKHGESFAVRALIRADHLEVLVGAAARHAPDRNVHVKS
jgi:hypothetical protein